VRINPLRARRERREAELETLDAFRRMRHVLRDDATELDAELTAAPSDVEVETAERRRDEALTALRGATTLEELEPAERLLVDARFHLARSVAQREGIELPERREPCTFDPRHGPAVTDVVWSAGGPASTPVPACRRCAARLANGDMPEVRASLVTAHVIRGTGWQSRVNEAEAMMRAGGDRSGAVGGNFPI
jgi:hypothetical protein